MTVTKYYKEYTINGTIYFVAQYWTKDAKVYLWRYGYKDINGLGVVLSDGLLTRPNIKRLTK